MKKSNTRTTLRRAVWIGYLALAIVFAQGMNLHIHTYDHEPLSTEDVHIEKVHLAISNGTANSDPGEEVDLSVQGIVKNISLHLFVVALLTVAGIFFVFLGGLSPPCSPRFVRATRPWRDQLPPPLRAPPA